MEVAYIKTWGRRNGCQHNSYLGEHVISHLTQDMRKASIPYSISLRDVPHSDYFYGEIFFNHMSKRNPGVCYYSRSQDAKNPNHNPA
jgi:hypothetical protein